MSSKEEEKKKWKEDAVRCAGSQSFHELIPISKVLSDKSEHVTILMCQKCFHMLNVEDIWANR